MNWNYHALDLHMLAAMSLTTVRDATDVAGLANH